MGCCLNGKRQIQTAVRSTLTAAPRRACRQTCNVAADFNSAESDFVFSTTFGVANAAERPQITGRTSLTTVVTDAGVQTKSRHGPTLLPVLDRGTYEEIQQVRMLSGAGRFDIRSLIVVQIVGGGVVSYPSVGPRDV